jgi:hypothetical protein
MPSVVKKMQSEVAAEKSQLRLTLVPKAKRAS